MPPASENAPEWEARLTDMGWGGKYGPYLYKLLHEPRLSRELARQADARSVCGVHCVALQPCPDPDERSQDRYVVQNWDLSPGADGDRGDGADWKFLAVFDGHGGEDLAEYAMIALPPLVRFALSSALLADAAPQAPPQLPARISSVLSDTLVAFDDAIARDITSLFPDRVEQLLALSDEQIRAIIGGGDGDDGETLRKVVRGMCGTTAVVALLDPERRNLWVASLGDSQAVLGERRADGTWNVDVLSSYHNGEDPDEAARVVREHPGEEDCIQDERVLGAIAITRALGDHAFKLPDVYTSRVFLNSPTPFRTHSDVRDWLMRNLTPPYVSNVPDVRHVSLPAAASPNSVDGPRAALLLCTDGLLDLSDDRDPMSTAAAARTAPRTRVAMHAKTWFEALCARGEENLALRVLRDALGGEDAVRVSRMLTVEMTGEWMDDTTVLVLPL